MRRRPVSERYPLLDLIPALIPSFAVLCYVTLIGQIVYHSFK